MDKLTVSSNGRAADRERTAAAWRGRRSGAISGGLVSNKRCKKIMEDRPFYIWRAKTSVLGNNKKIVTAERHDQPLAR
ncbi:MAG: hypothetical protein AAGC71_07660 [Pseudomonadota bacterium]